MGPYFARLVKLNWSGSFVRQAFSPHTKFALSTLFENRLFRPFFQISLTIGQAKLVKQLRKASPLLLHVIYPINLLFKNALPDPTFKYLSNSNAFRSFVNPIYVSIAQGAYLFVCGCLPALCSSSRLSRLSVVPI